MVIITQLIYLKHGQEEVFNQFEEIAIPIIAKYNGILMLRVRPDSSAYIESSIAEPYEIHLVKFDSQQDFDNFRKDEERRKFLHLKEQSIQSAIMIQGVQL
jgi:hypothetical protein